MKLCAKGTGVGEILHGILQPGQAEMQQKFGQLLRQGLALVLSALIIMVPMGQENLFAQAAPAPADNGQAAPQGPALTPDQLDQLVAPIALYPDALVAQVLAAATYPTQVVDADRWRQSQGNAPADQIAAVANTQNWDPSIKALTAFPSVLAQMDKNLQWTTDLGNAYFNQPQDVMDAVQAMRQKAEAAGQLHSTPQLAVSNDNGQVVIAPADPTVVYVPVYNPWTVYGVPLAVYPGFYWAPPYGIAWSGVGIGFGVGIGLAAFGGFGWGWGHWGMGWHDHTVVYNHGTYRPSGGRGDFGRGSYARGGRGGYGRGGTYAGGRGGSYGRGGSAGRGGTYAGGRGSTSGRGSTYGRGGSAGRGGNYGRAGSTGHSMAGRSASTGRSTSTAGRSASTGRSTSTAGRSASTGRSTSMAGRSASTGHSTGHSASTGHSSGGHSTMARSSGASHSGGGAPHSMAGHSGGGGGGHMGGGGGGHMGGGGGHGGGGGGHKR